MLLYGIISNIKNRGYSKFLGLLCINTDLVAIQFVGSWSINNFIGCLYVLLTSYLPMWYTHTSCDVMDFQNYFK
jgi:hypothetical protein